MIYGTYGPGCEKFRFQRLGPGIYQRLRWFLIWWPVGAIIRDHDTMFYPITGRGDASSTRPCSDDILLWPDGTFCYRYELHEMTHMGDDYKVLAFDSTEYNKFTESGAL